MRFSIVLAVLMVSVFVVLFIRATMSEEASAVVFGLLGFTGVYLFFKHIVNA